MEMKSPEIFIRFTFCSSVSLCCINREQIFHLLKSSWTMAYAVSLLIHNSSATNLSVSRRFCASICCTFSIISGVLLVVADLNVAHIQSFPSLRERVWTICKHIFYSWPPSRIPTPTFYMSLLQFSPICSRTWCLHIAPLPCDTTSHTDYIQLAAVSLLLVTCSPWCVSILPMSLKNMHLHAHMRQVTVQIWHHLLNFLDTLCIPFICNW